MPLLLLNEDELRQSVTLIEVIEAVKAGFVAQAEGRMHVPGDFVLNLPDVKGSVQVKGTYLDEAPYYVIKIGSSFYDNPTINLPTHSGLTTVFDAATGFPAALIMDNGYLSSIRAGAVGALAAAYLANHQLDHVAVLGCGNQAYIQLKSLMMIRPIGAVSVWSRSPANADNYARQMVEDHDVDIDIASSIEAAVRPADLIITATSSQEPLIQAAWLKPGVHITAVGSNSPAKQELQVEVLGRADVIIADDFSRCAQIGEIHHALAAKTISKEDVQGELGALITGRIPGRTHPEQITVADLTNLDIPDIVVATLALENALFMGLGQRIAGYLS